jgi:hypothetical protein
MKYFLLILLILLTYCSFKFPLDALKRDSLPVFSTLPKEDGYDLKFEGGNFYVFNLFSYFIRKVNQQGQIVESFRLFDKSKDTSGGPLVVQFAVTGERLFVLSDSIYELVNDNWIKRFDGIDTSKAYLLDEENGRIFAFVRNSGIFEYDTTLNVWEYIGGRVESKDITVKAIKYVSRSLFAGMGEDSAWGLYRLVNGDWQLICKSNNEIVDIEITSLGIFISDESFVYRLNEDSTAFEQYGDQPTNSIRKMAACRDTTLFIGYDHYENTFSWWEGIEKFQNNEWVEWYDNDFNSAAFTVLDDYIFALAHTENDLVIKKVKACE